METMSNAQAAVEIATQLVDVIQGLGFAWIIAWGAGKVFTINITRGKIQ